jgi:hypothetical protein
MADAALWKEAQTFRLLSLSSQSLAAKVTLHIGTQQEEEVCTKEEQLSDEQRERMLQIMATEHSVLQAGRSATIFETGGRITVFLGTVSSALIALAFVGQISRLGTAFFAFALVLLPTLFFLGLVTFERAMQLGVEDYIYAVGMSRIRHFYVEMVPQAERYFVGSIHDDFSTTMAPTVFGMPVGLAWQSLLTVPGAIAMVNSVIVGAFAGLLVAALIVESLAPSVGVGIAVFVVSLLLLRRHQIARWHQIEQRLPTLFPSEPTR